MKKSKFFKLFLLPVAISFAIPPVFALTACSDNEKITDPKSSKPYHTLNDQLSKSFYTKYNEFSFYGDIYFDNYVFKEGDYYKEDKNAGYFKENDPTTYARKDMQKPNLITNPGTHTYDYDKDYNNAPQWLKEQYQKFGKQLDGFPILPPNPSSERFLEYANNYQNFFINPEVASYFNDEDYTNINKNLVTIESLVNSINHSNAILGKLKLNGLYLNDIEKQNSIKIFLHPVLWNTILNDNRINEDRKINTLDLSFNNLIVAPNFATIVYYDNYENNQSPTGWLFDSSNKLGTIDLRNNKITMLNLNPEVPIDEFNNFASTDKWYSPGLANTVNQINNSIPNNNGLLIDYNCMPWLEHMKWSTAEMDNWKDSGHHLLKERPIYRYMKYTSSIYSITDPIESIIQRLLAVGLYQKDYVTPSKEDLHNFLLNNQESTQLSNVLSNELFYLHKNKEVLTSFENTVYAYINQNHLTSQCVFDLFMPSDFVWNQENSVILWNEIIKNDEWYNYYYCPLGFEENQLWNMHYQATRLEQFDYFNGIWKGCAVTFGSFSKKQYFDPNDKPSDPTSVSDWVSTILNEFNVGDVYSVTINGFKIDWTGLTINILVYGLLGVILITLLVYLAVKNWKNRNDSKKQYIRGRS